jgi:anti-sigma-K factor RskA
LNEEEYIASGLLESYALGLTTEAETAEVERALTHWPALQAHVEALREDLEAYVMAYAQTPPPALRSRVLDALAAEETRTVPLRADSDTDTTPAIRPRWGQPWLVAASIGLLILSLLGNLLLYGRWQGTAQRLEAAESRNTQLADQIGVQETRLETFSDEIALLRNPAVRRIELKAQPNVPASATALVYWNAQSRTAYLASASLPAAPAGQQYQLWAIVDGKPVAMEVFDAGTGFRQVSNVANAQAFAISLEARGGSTTEKGPQGPIYVLGAV